VLNGRDDSRRLALRTWVTVVLAGQPLAAQVDDIPTARIAVSALHGPIRLSTLGGAPEHAILLGNVNAQDWSPRGDRLVYVDDRGAGDYALSLADTFGVTRQLPVPMRSTWPRFSADEAWIYFFTQDDEPAQIYRIAPDGSGLESLLAGSFPAPAPDGRRIAMTTAAGVWVGNPVTRRGEVVPSTTPDAVATVWSPDGRWIAYRDRRRGGVTILRPDGSDVRVIEAPPIGGLSWSPDTRWLLGGNVDGGPLQLIDARTGASRFLPVRGVYPAWKPTERLLAAR
jgi:Tol biopolymer transport system component